LLPGQYQKTTFRFYNSFNHVVGKLFLCNYLLFISNKFNTHAYCMVVFSFPVLMPITPNILVCVKWIKILFSVLLFFCRYLETGTTGIFLHRNDEWCITITAYIFTNGFKRKCTCRDLYL